MLRIFLILVFSIATILVPPTLQAFSIATYNLHNINDPEGLKADLLNLKSISVFAFQEVRFNINRDDSILESVLPPEYKYITSEIVALDDNQNYEGHAIVSKYPILRSQVIKLNHSGEKNREALVAWLQVDDQEILVVNTDHEVDFGKLSFFDRKKQIESLIEALNEINFSGVQIILGDFNTSDSIPNWMYGISGEIEVQKTYELFKNEGWIPVLSSLPEDYTLKSWGITQHLDHIILKNAPENKSYYWNRFENRKGSDHFPIYISFRHY